MKMLRKIKLKVLLFRRHYSSNYRYHRFNGKRQIRGGDSEEEGRSGAQSSFRGAAMQSHSSSKFLGAAPPFHNHHHHQHHISLSMNPLKRLLCSKLSCIKSTACSLPLKKKSSSCSSSGSPSSSSSSGPNSNVGVLPRDVHKGSCAVYVGPEHKRFVMKTCYLEHPVFGVLLQKSEEEFGFEYSGGLLIPCPVAVFEYLLRLMKRNDPSIQSREITQLINSSCIPMQQPRDRLAESIQKPPNRSKQTARREEHVS